MRLKPQHRAIAGRAPTSRTDRLTIHISTFGKHVSIGDDDDSRSRGADGDAARQRAYVPALPSVETSLEITRVPTVVSGLRAKYTTGKIDLMISNNVKTSLLLQRVKY